MDDESDRAGVTVTDSEALAKLRADLAALIAEAEAEPASPQLDEWIASVRAQLALVPDEPVPLTPQQEANQEDWLRRAATAHDRCKRWEGSEEQKANHSLLEAGGIRIVSKPGTIPAGVIEKAGDDFDPLAYMLRAIAKPWREFDAIARPGRHVVPRPLTIQRGDDVIRRLRPRVDGSSRLTHGPPEAGDDDPHPCERRRRSAERGSL